MATATYKVVFERIGHGYHDHEVLLHAADGDPDALAEAIFRYCRNKLASKEFWVDVDVASDLGTIDFGRFGRFSFEKVSVTA